MGGFILGCLSSQYVMGWSHTLKTVFLIFRLKNGIIFFKIKLILINCLNHYLHVQLLKGISN